MRKLLLESLFAAPLTESPPAPDDSAALELAALLASTAQSDARVRNAVVAALGGYYHHDAFAALKQSLATEKNPGIQATALRALGPYAQPEARDLLVKFLNTPSYRDRLAEAALAGMKAQDDPAFLAPLLAVDRADLERRLADTGTSFTYVAREVDVRLAAKVRKLDLAGIGFLLARHVGASVKTLSTVSFHALSPCLVFHQLVTSRVGLGQSWRVVAFCVLATGLIGLAARVSASALRLEGTTLTSFLLVVMFSNSGNLSDRLTNASI